MGLFESSVMGMEAHPSPHHNFVVIAAMIMKFSTSIKLDVFYTMATERLVTPLLLRDYDIITCILADDSPILILKTFKISV